MQSQVHRIQAVQKPWKSNTSGRCPFRYATISANDATSTEYQSGEHREGFSSASTKLSKIPVTVQVQVQKMLTEQKKRPPDTLCEQSRAAPKKRCQTRLREFEGSTRHENRSINAYMSVSSSAHWPRGTKPGQSQREEQYCRKEGAQRRPHTKCAQNSKAWGRPRAVSVRTRRVQETSVRIRRAIAADCSTNDTAKQATRTRETDTSARAREREEACERKTNPHRQQTKLL